MDYFEKIEVQKEDLTWNIPETNQGSVNVIGGNSKHFKTEIKTTEFISKYPIKSLKLILPNSLKSQLPNLPNFVFLESTDSGSFANENELLGSFNSADYNLLLGDLSKNTITEKAVATACKNSEKPLLITRDSIDLITNQQTEKVLMSENVILMASMAQLQKLFRAVYYPKMLLLSQSLIQVAETLHKFTLSYPTKIITLHSDQILIAENGQVKAIQLAKTNYNALSFWQGEVAAKIAALNLYNPNNFINATISAFFS